MKPCQFLISCLIVCFCALSSSAQVVLNGDLEQLNQRSHFPIGWVNNGSGKYDFKVDSNIVKNGKYALSIASKNNEGDFGQITRFIPGTFAGQHIQLKAYLKTENVKGYAGFWLRIDGTRAFNSMNNQQIEGTNDWKEYTIDLPYDANYATDIDICAFLTGTGKIWFDDVRLYLDGKPIETVANISRKVHNAMLDDGFSDGSGIVSIDVNEQTAKNLALLGQVWGFVKYHLTQVAQGDINMDAELFRVMPLVLKAKNNREVNEALEQWLDKLGAPPACTSCSKTDDKAVIKPDYGMLFDKNVVSASLIKKFTNILNNRTNGMNYYIDQVPEVGSPVFKNELPYERMEFPDAGFRLLTLFRYWNMVQYFSPNRVIMGQDWNKVLRAYIPRFIDNKTATEYELTTLALIAKVHDTHANIWNNLKPLSAFMGMLSPPFQGKFIENKLTVTGFYNDTLKVKQNFKLGDVITAIDGVPVTDLVKKYQTYTPASNYETQLRDMPINWLLRTNRPVTKYQIQREDNVITINQENLARTKIKFYSLVPLGPNEPGYHLIDNKIGYLYAAKYYNKDLPAIKNMFKDTRGIIVDMRCYPSDVMPFTFVPYIKNVKSDFAKITIGSLNTPGQFVNGATVSAPSTGEYKAKVVVIVDANSQSAAEYTTMAFQSSTNVTVIGSTTAGADGNVSEIVLPGGIKTRISGIGIFYPDGTPTQRVGVKVNEVVKPTIAGIKAGRDELLERAKQIILN